jgi:hypothetical protein
MAKTGALHGPALLTQDISYQALPAFTNSRFRN